VFGFLRRLFRPVRSDPLDGLERTRLRLIVGLGNPGSQYADTRHNLGFLCADELVRRCQASWTDDTGRTRSLLAVGHTDDLSIVLAKPQTYMNRSGESVSELVERLGLELQHVLVVYDDMDLPFGTLRLRERGSPGTHNGMRSVVGALGEAVPRLRIGIGQASPGGAIDHVLGGFTAEEEDEARQLVSRSADAAHAWATESAVAAMNRYNRA
jgi:PTH1 family peptidyl-tRNA hydrolase